ncbi:BrnA antitoxin family protein [Variovorax sp. J31P179]|uniref:BrnA antitoxin family protein n=1 Tax=Variovorax sp. J31P179 TaxID=3053508 RepID=UPI0025759B5B|nr:BrnA antitoxin family protein [Variovorax sp. J31P179]MDM0082287.1 BrnA antitoxin family protein [Variovorax sp. J31P179]
MAILATIHCGTPTGRNDIHIWALAYHKHPFESVKVRYSQEVVEFSRATGGGWQSRMDGVLKEYVAQHLRG